jgi:hypothetical protein
MPSRRTSEPVGRNGQLLQDPSGGDSTGNFLRNDGAVYLLSVDKKAALVSDSTKPHAFSAYPE